MKSDPFITVEDADHAAIGKTVFFQRTAHGRVVHMGIDAKVGTLRERPVENAGNETLPPVGNGDAVDDAVGLVIEPTATLDLQIGGIGALNIGKHAADLTILFAYIQLPFGNVFPQDAFRRVIVPPLVGIAGAAHKCPCFFINLKNFRQIGKFRRTNHITHNYTPCFVDVRRGDPMWSPETLLLLLVIVFMQKLIQGIIFDIFPGFAQINIIANDMVIIRSLP